MCQAFFCALSLHLNVSLCVSPCVSLCASLCVLLDVDRCGLANFATNGSKPIAVYDPVAFGVGTVHDP